MMSSAHKEVVMLESVDENFEDTFPLYPSDSEELSLLSESFPTHREHEKYFPSKGMQPNVYPGSALRKGITAERGGVGGPNLGKKVALEWEHDPHDPSGDGEKLNNMQTLVHLFKLFTGPSMLGMASIIRSGGLLFGLVGYLLVGYLNTSCNILVVKCAHMITHRTGRTNMHFEHLMEECVLLHTEYRHCRRMASWIRKTTLCFIVMCQIGFLCFYIKIIGTMLQSELVRLITNYPLSMAMTQLVVCVALIPYMWLRSLKLLAWASLLGNIFTLVCAVTILQVSVRSLQPVSHVPLINTDMWMLPVLVGSSVFSVEGITMTIPVHNKTKNPRDFGGACGLLMVATTCTLCLNSAIGFFAYLSVGDEVTGNLLVTLPNEWGYTAVKFAYALVVFLTFALQGYLPGEILAAKIKESSKIDVVTRQADKIARTAVVVVTYLVAALIPNVELAMSLCGSFTVVFIVFIFPPVAEMLILSKDEGGVPKLVLVKDCAILVFGVLAFFTGTYTSIRDIILAF